MANIRNQDSWVHADDPVAATEKAKDLVRMAVAKVALLEPLQENELTIHQDALVIGGGHGRSDRGAGSWPIRATKPSGGRRTNSAARRATCSGPGEAKTSRTNSNRSWPM